MPKTSLPFGQAAGTGMAALGAAGNAAATTGTSLANGVTNVATTASIGQGADATIGMMTATSAANQKLSSTNAVLDFQNQMSKTLKDLARDAAKAGQNN